MAHRPGPALVGRLREREAIDRLLEAVRAGQSRVLVLRGEAGIGKSALLEHLLGAATGCRITRAVGVESALIAMTQRPIAESALGEPSGDRPLWKTVPSWFVFGDEDRNIPVGAHRIMAERADSSRTLEIAGASHVVGISHPTETAEMIIEAARSRSAVEA